MHFDQRTQTALREYGLSTDEIDDISESVVEATAAEADAIESFLSGLGTAYSDMDPAHSSTEYPQHDLADVELYTHAAARDAL